MRLSFCLLLILITQCLSIHAYAVDTDLTGQESRIEDESLRTAESLVQSTTDDSNSQTSTQEEADTSISPQTETAPSLPTSTTTTTEPFTGTTVTRTTITTTTTTTTTTTEQVWTKEPSPNNPTWAIVGGLVGGIGGLGLIGAGVGVYMCFRASQQRTRSRVRSKARQEDIPLESSDNF